jgi:hypothetical protein
LRARHPKRSAGWLGVGLVLVAAVLSLGRSVRAAKAPAAVEGPIDETLKEVVLSLDASSVARVSLERYARDALDALATFDRCLSRSDEGQVLTLSCAGTTWSTSWPPTRAIDVAALLSSAARLVDLMVGARDACERGPGGRGHSGGAGEGGEAEGGEGGEAEADAEAAGEAEAAEQPREGRERPRKRGRAAAAAVPDYFAE